MNQSIKVLPNQEKSQILLLLWRLPWSLVRSHFWSFLLYPGSPDMRHISWCWPNPGLTLSSFTECTLVGNGLLVAAVLHILSDPTCSSHNTADILPCKRWGYWRIMTLPLEWGEGLWLSQWPQWSMAENPIWVLRLSHRKESSSPDWEFLSPLPTPRCLSSESGASFVRKPRTLLD